MLRQFLPSVIAYSEAEGVEVCVADNASSDASCDVVRKEFPAVRLIELEENYGFAEGITVPCSRWMRNMWFF